MDKLRLITNIHLVDVVANGKMMRIYCSALLLEKVLDLDPAVGKRPQLRGIGADPTCLSATAFEFPLNCGPLDYTHSLPTGYDPLKINFEFRDGTTIIIATRNENMPLDIEDYVDHAHLSGAIPRKIRQYWPSFKHLGATRPPF